MRCERRGADLGSGDSRLPGHFRKADGEWVVARRRVLRRRHSSSGLCKTAHTGIETSLRTRCSLVPGRHRADTCERRTHVDTSDGGGRLAHSQPLDRSAKVARPTPSVDDFPRARGCAGSNRRQAEAGGSTRFRTTWSSPGDVPSQSAPTSTAGEIVTNFTDHAGNLVEADRGLSRQHGDVDEPRFGKSIPLVATGSFQARAHPDGSVSFKITGHGASPETPSPEPGVWYFSGRLFANFDADEDLTSPGAPASSSISAPGWRPACARRRAQQARVIDFALVGDDVRVNARRRYQVVVADEFAGCRSLVRMS